jgi:hypothetical protein
MLTHLKKPNLSQSVIQDLEKHGVDAIRSLLVSSTDGLSGTGRKTQIPLGGAVTVTRGEIQDWLKWKEAKDACWVKVGVIAAIAAAIFSFMALLKK